MLAVDVRARLHDAWRELVELRATRIVRVHLDDTAVRVVQLDLMTGDVVGQLSANQADRNAAARQIVHGPRNARHLLRVGHLELSSGHGDKHATAEDAEDAEEILQRPQRPSRPRRWRFPDRDHSFAPHCLQNLASASRTAPQPPQKAAAAGSGTSPTRFRRSCSTCVR